MMANFRAERLARLLAIVIALGIPLAVLLAGVLPARGSDVTEVHARMPERGGFLPGDLTVKAGASLQLRLVSDDVLHGFAVGQSNQPAVDLLPGQPQDLTLQFDQPGTYTYYCTRWCGPNHWRMRGVIEVLPAGEEQPAPLPATSPPLYQQLGIDLDATHPADPVPARKPSASRGSGIDIPAAYLSQAYYRSHSPADIWNALRYDPFTAGLADEQVWNLVARIWAANTTPERLAAGQALYAQNCAACHGEAGDGKGVFASKLSTGISVENASIEDASIGDANMADSSQTTGSHTAPADFTNLASMPGASPALLHGKITRGGMGTGMPYWGPIFTEEQIWTLVEYLGTFQFNP